MMKMKREIRWQQPGQESREGEILISTHPSFRGSWGRVDQQQQAKAGNKHKEEAAAAAAAATAAELDWSTHPPSQYTTHIIHPPTERASERSTNRPPTLEQLPTATGFKSCPPAEADQLSALLRLLFQSVRLFGPSSSSSSRRHMRCTGCIFVVHIVFTSSIDYCTDISKRWQHTTFYIHQMKIPPFLLLLLETYNFQLWFLSNAYSEPVVWLQDIAVVDFKSDESLFKTADHYVVKKGEKERDKTIGIQSVEVGVCRLIEVILLFLFYPLPVVVVVFFFFSFLIRCVRCVRCPP